MTKRLLLPSELPTGMWKGSQDSLLIPHSLCCAYRRMLEDKGLYECATEGPQRDGPVGGMSESDTQEHFATRFSGSAARTQLAVLDPKDELADASDLFVRTFAGGRVGLLDIPSGAGAASADLLATVAALREAGVFPRQPLHVDLVAGDVSEYARTYAAELLASIKGPLARQSIFLNEHLTHWDVLDAESTTAILHEWMQCAPDCREYFVVLANFSGFMESQRKFGQAKPQLSEIFRWAALRRSTVMWLEPQTNVATEGLFPRVLGWLREKMPRLFGRSCDVAECHMTSNCRYIHPVKVDCAPSVRLSLIRLEASDP